MAVDDADVLIIGGGIAGLSAAWFASRAGRRVTLIDEAVHRASDLPVALVNPLRGRAGRLVADGVDGMHATFAMIDALRAGGHRITAARGLFRPLIGVSQGALRPAFWTDRLGGLLACDWHDVAPRSLGLASDAPALWLRDAGWLVPAGLLVALEADAAPTRLHDRVIAIRVDDASATGGGEVRLASGTRMRARSLLWCGGAWGAASLDRMDGDVDDAADDTMTDVTDGIYKPGSLLLLDGQVTSEPLTFGLYACPIAGAPPRTIIGPTREAAMHRFSDAQATRDVVGHLEDRVAATFGASITVTGVWRGVRLTRLSTTAARRLRGVPTLTALGSRGFLAAPLLASRWARSL